MGALRILLLRTQSPQSFDLVSHSLKPHLHIFKHQLLLLQIVLMLLDLFEMHLFLLFQTLFLLALFKKLLLSKLHPLLSFRRRRHHHHLILGEVLYRHVALEELERLNVFTGRFPILSSGRKRRPHTSSRRTSWRHDVWLSVTKASHHCGTGRAQAGQGLAPSQSRQTSTQVPTTRQARSRSPSTMTATALSRISQVSRPTKVGHGTQPWQNCVS